MRWTIKTGFALLFLSSVPLACGDDESAADTPTSFVIRVENISTADEFETVSGGTYSASLAPGVWMVHSADASLFQVGAVASTAMESLAEDGAPSAMSTAFQGSAGVESAGVFASQDQVTYAEAPITAGQSVEFSVTAVSGQRLSLAAMFAESNDIVIATPPEGIALFGTDGTPIATFGDVFAYYDVGTEVNEEPGVGENQPASQSGVNTGPDEGGVVSALVNDHDGDGFGYPGVGLVVRVTIRTE